MPVNAMPPKPPLIDPYRFCASMGAPLPSKRGGTMSRRVVQRASLPNQHDKGVNHGDVHADGEVFDNRAESDYGNRHRPRGGSVPPSRPLAESCTDSTGCSDRSMAWR